MMIIVIAIGLLFGIDCSANLDDRSIDPKDTRRQQVAHHSSKHTSSLWLIIYRAPYFQQQQSHLPHANNTRSLCLKISLLPNKRYNVCLSDPIRSAPIKRLSL